MSRMSEFVTGAGGWAMASELAALVFYIVGLIGVSKYGATITPLVMIVVSVPLFWLGAYKSWSTLKDEVDDLKSNRARLVIYEKEPSTFISRVEEHNRKPNGCYLEFFIEIENKGNRTSNIRCYSLSIRETGVVHEGIQPQPQQNIQGAASLYGRGRNDWFPNPISVPEHGIASGVLPFLTSDSIAPELCELHCVLTLVDTGDARATREFVVRRQG